MTSEIIIIGAGGHAVSIANVALSCSKSIIGFIDNNRYGESLLGLPILNRELCEKKYPNFSYVIGIGDNAVRKKVLMEFKDKCPKAQFPNLIHKSATIGMNSRIGQGSVIMPQVNIGPKSIIGDFCIINTGGLLDHDCVMGDFSSIAPGVNTGGNVQIGNYSAISIGATIKHGIKIGTDSVIGAASYVDKDVEDGIVSYGIPSKKIRSRQRNDPYLS